MKHINRISPIILGAALVLAICVSSVQAGAPATIPALFDGRVVSIIPGVSDNVVGVDKKGIVDQAANPLYVVPGQEVDHVLGGGAPGVAGYNPFWKIVIVTVLNDRDVSTDPFLSEAEILEAAANGEVSLTNTGFILLCQVVGG